MIKSLNGLRALLFLFIFGGHFKWVIIYSALGRKLFYFFDIGRFTILFFILLSGFCVALGYADKFKALSKNIYLNFIKKRFVKLYPLYLLSGLAGLFFIFLPQGIKWLYLFIGIYVPMLTSWLNINGGGNTAGWFIGVILACYTVVPAALYLFGKKENLKFHIIFSFINYLILAVFSIYLVYANDPNNEFCFRFPPIRILEYLIALDLGYLFVKRFRNKLEFKILDNYFCKSLIDILFIGVFYLIMYVLPNNLLYRHLIGIPVICLFIVYLCIEKRSFLFDIFSSKVCNFFGNISFECYMIHLIVFQLLDGFSKKYLNTIPDIILLYLILLVITVTTAFIYKKAESCVRAKLSQIKAD